MIRGDSGVFLWLVVGFSRFIRMLVEYLWRILHPSFAFLRGLFLLGTIIVTITSVRVNRVTAYHTRLQRTFEDVT
jgi:hypothetical protein